MGRLPYLRRGRWGILGLGVLALALVLVGGAARADGVEPTNEWINLYGMNSTWHGEALPVGSTVAVFGSDGAKCGEVTVTEEGWYGLMPCYRGTASSEALQPGEAGSIRAAGAEDALAEGGLTFQVNGQAAEPLVLSLNGNPMPPETVVTWGSNGDFWQVDLRGPARSHAVGGYVYATGRRAVIEGLRVPLLVLGGLIALAAAYGIGRWVTKVRCRIPRR